MKPDITTLEEELRVAMCKSDLEKLEELLAPDLLFTTHLGSIVTKKDDLDAHRNGEFTFESIDLSDLRVLNIDDGFIVSTLANITGSYKGTATSGTFRFTRVWKDNGGHWQVLAGHASIVA